MHPTRMAAEWSRQDAVLLAWPDELTDWSANLNNIHRTYRKLIAEICKHQSVVLLIHKQANQEKISEYLNQDNITPGKIIFVVANYNDTWLRDSGPINLISESQHAFIDYRFNGWGQKFEAAEDDQICKQLFTQPEFKHNKLIHSDIILEGGSIDTNGEGIFLTTSSCLLTTTRNPALSRKDYERHFSDVLGIRETIWLEHGELAGDDTDGHIDMLARFCNQDTIAFTCCDDKHDPHYPELLKMRHELEALARFELIELPIPKPILSSSGQRLPASYANFLIINDAVIVPVYEDKNDELVCQRLDDVFSDREVVPVNARSVIQQGGSLHCLSMQLNEGFLSN